MHDIGKNIVRILLSTSGFEVVDLGRDVKVATIIGAAEDEKADIIGVSAPDDDDDDVHEGAHRGALRGWSPRGLQGHGRRCAGHREWAREIGADGYAKDAFAAIGVAKDLLSVKGSGRRDATTGSARSTAAAAGAVRCRTTKGVYDVVTFWDVVERTSHGERMKESDFDAMLWQNVRALIEKYDIHFDGETAVPDDDGLADRAYQAALELFLATGFYCTSTQRAVRFTREEVEEAVRHAKTSYVFGEGRDQHTMVPRTVEDPKSPTCIFSHLGVPVKQDVFPKVCQAHRDGAVGRRLLLRLAARHVPRHPDQVRASGRGRGVHVGHHQAP